MKEKLLSLRQKYEDKFNLNLEKMKNLSKEYDSLKLENEQLRGAYAALNAALNEEKTLEQGEENGTKEN